jgi:hypothetical protein
LFEPGNIPELLGRIAEIQRPGKVEELSMNARKAYVERYTPERNYEALMDIYQQAMVGFNLKRHAR